MFQAGELPGLLKGKKKGGLPVKEMSGPDVEAPRGALMR